MQLPRFRMTVDSDSENSDDARDALFSDHVPEKLIDVIFNTPVRVEPSDFLRAKQQQATSVWTPLICDDHSDGDTALLLGEAALNTRIEAPIAHMLDAGTELLRQRPCMLAIRRLRITNIDKTVGMTLNVELRDDTTVIATCAIEDATPKTKFVLCEQTPLHEAVVVLLRAHGQDVTSKSWDWRGLLGVAADQQVVELPFDSIAGKTMLQLHMHRRGVIDFEERMGRSQPDCVSVDTSECDISDVPGDVEHTVLGVELPPPPPRLVQAGTRVADHYDIPLVTMSPVQSVVDGLLAMKITETHVVAHVSAVDHALKFLRRFVRHSFVCRRSDELRITVSDNGLTTERNNVPGVGVQFSVACAVSVLWYL